MVVLFFLVWTTAAGEVREIGPFRSLAACEEAIAHARAAPQSRAWRLPRNARCVERLAPG
ncbi:hypothetical protein [Elioraea sp.]|uniref:hypothetical protein n=1 Tax=Elioraea sp. TaxID=2185103 RepID=UPI0025C0F461|nr:hypothetical protein [Elioraea sp.]